MPSCCWGNELLSDEYQKEERNADFTHPWDLWIQLMHLEQKEVQALSDNKYHYVPEDFNDSKRLHNRYRKRNPDLHN